MGAKVIKLKKSITSKKPSKETRDVLHKIDTRLDRVIEFIVRLSSLDFSVKLKPSESSEAEHDDSINALEVGLNMLSDDLEEIIRQLKETEKRFEILSEASEEAIVIADDGVVIDTNQKFLDLFGYTRDEIKGQFVYYFIAPDSREAVLEKILNEHEGRYEAHLLKKDGSTFPARVSAKMMPYKGRDVKVAAIVNLTDRMQAEEKLRVSERMASIGQLSASIAHEINNPLAYVIASLELMQNKTEESSEMGKMVTETLSAAHSIHQIISDVKTFSNQGGASGEAELSSLRIESVLDSALRLASISLSKRARVERIFDNTPEVLGHAGRLGQIFLNLVMNASQAMPSDRNPEKNCIQISTQDSDGFVVVKVTDNGGGISAENIKNIFTPFFTTKKAGAGVGLGLSLCKNFLESMGGHIKVESKVGVGTTFQVLLRKSEKATAAASVAKSHVHEAIRGKILIVDDNRTLAKVMSEVLKADGHEIVISETGSEGLEHCLRAQFDLLLVDMHLSDMTGAQFYAQFSAVFPGREDRIVFVTGGVSEKELVNFLKKTSNEVIEKPFFPKDFRARVMKVLSELKASSRT